MFGGGIDKAVMLRLFMDIFIVAALVKRPKSFGLFPFLSVFDEMPKTNDVCLAEWNSSQTAREKTAGGESCWDTFFLLLIFYMFDAGHFSTFPQHSYENLCIGFFQYFFLTDSFVAMYVVYERHAYIKVEVET